MECGTCKALNFLVEHEADGEAFLLLTDEQLKSLVKAFEPQMKLIKRRNEMKVLNYQVRVVSNNRKLNVQFVIPLTVTDRRLDR